MRPKSDIAKFFEARAKAKQASREEDERALQSGEKTAEQLQQENSTFGGLAKDAKLMLDGLNMDSDSQSWRMSTSSVVASGEDFDEIVVGDWLHAELMSENENSVYYWVRIGNRCFTLSIDKDTGDLNVPEIEERNGYPFTSWPKEIVHEDG